MGSMIEFQRPDGAATRGWWAEAGAGRPAVIVIQEWWGLNPHICGIADRLAEVGFNALAPDLYRGRVAADADEAQHMMSGLDFADATHQDLAGALRHAATGSGKLGVTGFCMGGALTVAAAVHLPAVAAASCFYGLPPVSFADPARIKTPFQGHFGDRDDWITPALVDGLEATLRGTGQTPEIYRYAADHAFFNATRPEVYDAECAQQAWQRLLSFFGRTLA